MYKWALKLVILLLVFSAYAQNPTQDPIYLTESITRSSQLGLDVGYPFQEEYAAIWRPVTVTSSNNRGVVPFVLFINRK